MFNHTCRRALLSAFCLLMPGLLLPVAPKKTTRKTTINKTATPKKPTTANKPKSATASKKPAIVIDNRYQDIEKLYTSMLTKKELEKLKPAPALQNGFQQLWGFFKAAFAKNPYSLPKLDRADLIFNSLGKLKFFNANADPIARTAVTNRNVWENLELFTNSSRIGHKTVVGATKRTETTIGELIYTRMLLDPETNADIIKARQKFIRLLVEDDNVFEDFCAIIKAVAQEEESLISLMLATDSMRQDHILNSYNTVGILQSSKAISGALNLQAGLSMFTFAVGALSATILDVAAIKFITDFDGSCASAARRSRKMLRRFRGSHETDQQIESQVTQAINEMKNRSNYKTLKAFIPTAIGIFGAYMTFVTISVFGQLRRDAQTAAYIQRRLSSVNALFRALAAINSLPAVQMVSELRVQSERYADTTEVELEELARRLDKNKFVPPADGGMPGTLKTVFSGKGDVANALLEAKKVIAKASDGMILIGHLDAYLSVAKLLRERKQSHAPYCFVEILENQSTPVINATDFHHPVVNEKTVVTNSIAIGTNNNPSSIMISGVNAGGKSTHMKAIALCCIFGQVFGVAPARSFSFTPFHTINTYLNITDDVSKQQSLFRAEITRAQELLSTVNTLPRNQFSFTILDEICTGTERIEGEALAVAIAKKLGMYSNSLLLLASHFPGLTTLAKNRKDLYKNMKVIVEKDENGEFVYPYGLYEGSTTQQIAPDLLEKIGLPLVMTQKMRDVLNHPDRYVPTKE